MVGGENGSSRLVKPLSKCTTMNTPIGPRQYSVLQAAEYLRLHPRTIYELAQEKQIKSRRKGPRRGRLFFLEDDLEAYLYRNSTGEKK